MPANNADRQGGTQKKDLTEEGWAAAKILYETTPGMTMKELAAQFGFGKSTIERRANAEGWKKCHHRPDNAQLNEEARELAQQYLARKQDIIENGAEPDDAAGTAADLIVREHLIREKAELIERHRSEWKIVNSLMAEHVRARDLDKARLTKLTAETMKIKQDGERRAWGIDVSQEDNTIVIERD